MASTIGIGRYLLSNISYHNILAKFQNSAPIC